MLKLYTVGTTSKFKEDRSVGDIVIIWTITAWLTFPGRCSSIGRSSPIRRSVDRIESRSRSQDGRIDRDRVRARLLSRMCSRRNRNGISYTFGRKLARHLLSDNYNDNSP